MKHAPLFLFLAAIMTAGAASAQTINQYTIPRATGTMVMDGVLDEPAWSEAPYTENFVKYLDGATPQYPTRAKMLWDDTNLYIAFEVTDDDIWSTKTKHDDSLYKEEVVEIFIDPNGDGLNYFEIEINPLGTVWDLWLNHPWSVPGAKATSSWNLQDFTLGNGLGIVVNGTVNDDSDTDTGWVMECKIPFADINFNDEGTAFPPQEFDTWRLNLYRFERQRPTPSGLVEETGWNQTDSRQFHAPDLFGRVVFGGGPVGVSDAPAPAPVSITGNYPNPFNPETAIEFTLSAESRVRLELFSTSGQKVRTLANEVLPAGIHQAVWDGSFDDGAIAPTGLYIVRLEAGGTMATHRILLMK